MFKPGDRVVVIDRSCDAVGCKGTVMNKKSDPDRTWIMFDFLPPEYGMGDKPVDSHCTTSILELDELYYSPLYQALR